MPELPEVTTIRKSQTDINDTITKCDRTRWFAGKLAEEDFIPSQSAFAAPGISDSDRVAKMIEAVLAKLKNAGDPRKTHEIFETFMDILDDDQAVLKDLIKRLNEKYSKHCGCINLVCYSFFLEAIIIYCYSVASKLANRTPFTTASFARYCFLQRNLVVQKLDLDLGQGLSLSPRLCLRLELLKVRFRFPVCGGQVNITVLIVL